MHSRELIELAALVASHGREFIEAGSKVSESGVQQYWSASKCRLDRWSRSLKEYSTQIQQDQTVRSDATWREVCGVLEEILTGETLTRVWTGLACAHDRVSGSDQMEPIVRSVFVGHLEARNRALNLMVYGQGFGIEQAVKLNQLRRRTERWTDILLGSLMGETSAPGYDISELAFDAQRARDFAGGRSGQQEEKGVGQSWPVVLKSLRAAFEHGLCPVSPNSDLNEQIAAGVLSCLDSEGFDSTSLMRTTWQMRLDQTTNRAQGLIDQILLEDRGLNPAR